MRGSWKNFYPRPPRGGRLFSWLQSSSSTSFLSTPSARRATNPSSWYFLLSWISIHALREEGDFRCKPVRLRLSISIHALREEGDLAVLIAAIAFCRFLSTPSARRATKRVYKMAEYDNISIHALREEGDVGLSKVRGNAQISIHALREEGDFIDFYYFYCPNNFYPRPPRGGRQGRGDPATPAGGFLSTPSARRATTGQGRRGAGYPISIHALREEGDSTTTSLPVSLHRFLSTPSARRATTTSQLSQKAASISIHALREEGDASCQSCLAAGSKFLSTPSARRATTT